MSSHTSRDDAKKRVRWADKAQRDSKGTPHPPSSDLHPPSVSSANNGVRASDSSMKPSKPPIKASGTPKGAPRNPVLHPILAYFVFDWDVRASQLPESLPDSARDEPAFPHLNLDRPKPIKLCFDTQLGAKTCIVNPIEKDGKLVTISVGRVLLCISRELYTALEPTALHAGHPLLRAVHQAAVGRAYDPEPDRNKRVPRNVDLYPLPSSQPDAPLYFWYIEVQHAQDMVRLVVRCGPKPLKAIA